jgi:phytol kinase
VTSIGWAPWVSSAVLVLGLLLLGAGLRVLQQSAGLSPEATRKLFHLGCGAAALSLPWLFESVWPVVALSAVIGTLFLLLRLVPGLRAGPGQVLQAVSRQSKGEFWFMLGVLTIFMVARASVVVYSIGILVLALADTAAALVGVFYGRHTFKVAGGSKSLEGSAALFLTALFCVHVPLLLFTDTGRLETLLVALNVSLVLTLAEADTALGSDNFVLPVLVVVLLKMLLETDVAELALQSGVFLALVVFGFLYQERTTLSADALITAGLAGYVIWVFGGWQWLLVPVVMFSTYTWLVGRPRLASSRPFHAGVLLAIVGPGVVLATAHAVLGLEMLYPPFVAVWGANLAVIGMLHGWLNDPEVAPLRLALVNAAKSLVVLIPGIVADGSYEAWAIAGTALALVASLVLFFQLGRPLRREPTRPGAWSSLTLSVAGGTVVAFALVAIIEKALGARFQ